MRNWGIIKTVCGIIIVDNNRANHKFFPAKRSLEKPKAIKLELSMLHAILISTITAEFTKYLEKGARAKASLKLSRL